MEWIVESSWVVVLFVGLLLGGLWIPFAMGAAASLLLFTTNGWSGFNAYGLITWGSVNSFTLTAIPMFILMAEVLVQSGVGARVYRGLAVSVRYLPGGLLQTNILGCALFSAISGSSVATAAAIGTVALPELEERNYDPKLSAGTLAAGGTLGILIPPSIAMILYGSFTEVSIAKLFMAGVLPGLLLAALFMAYVAVRALLRPDLAPRRAMAAQSMLATASQLLPFVVLIGLVLGGIYFGVVTPTEAGAVGSALSLLIAVIWGRFGWREFRIAIRNSTRVSAGLLFIVLAAYLFAYAVEDAGIASSLTEWFVGLKLGRIEFIVVIFAMYLVLGCVIDSIGMMVLTVPLLYPVLLEYGIDPIWFGVVLVVMIELGQITPPVGINLFVIQSIWNGRIGQVIVGTAPFVLIMIAFVALLTVWPELALYLPSRM
ncbi:TRAP transporter large permease [Reyranella sp.]|uniref:TRAP transporter large permease n=1 Tax=Reyranella sp. TaxID=1929291 RepID=UPI003BABBE88